MADRIAEEVAQRLEPFYQAEFSRLEEGEKAASAIAVSDTLNAAKIDLDLLVEHNLEPLLLEKHFRMQMPDAAKRAVLSLDATQLYDITLRESCNYISEIARTLPDFQSTVMLEALKREDEIIDLVRRILDNLPSSLGNLSEIGSDQIRFEDQYRKEAARVLDRLTLFGVGDSEATQRYKLSVAYISLSAVVDSDATSSGPARRDAGEALDAALEVEDDEVVRVDDALASLERGVIRGQAGSGKTTLLQWLAVNSAKNSFEGHLSHLNGTVPFFIQLRRYVDKDFPAPGQFIEHVSTLLANMIPTGWVESTLEDGRALVLIDGVDELPASQREPLKDWLIGLCGVFPKSRFFVTSRPGAIENRWLRAEGFKDTELQPMDIADVKAFIRHWHAAAAQDVHEEADQEELYGLRDRLEREVVRNSGVRVLASAPLLCAVLCTLNRARRNLPNDRIELYGFALDLLLETRDSARDLKIAESIDLTLRQKKALVRDLAYWLILNNHSDVTPDRAAELLGKKLTELDEGSLDPSEVFAYLLVRSGLLREPVEGRVDFIHRTFQEFLAADEALEQEHIGVLLSNAHLDSWREVVILAAGLARSRQREELLRGLLERGRAEKRYKHRLHLLAVACLETSPVLEESLRAEVGAALAELMPPTSLTDAASVASAGALAVPLLTKYKDKNAPIARACVRALGSIASADALEAIVRYGGDTRVTVQRELLKMWSFFDTEDYATRVLARTPFKNIVSLSGGSQLHAARHLTRAPSLSCTIRDEEGDLSGVQAVPALNRLELIRAGTTSLEPLRNHPSLAILTLADCFGVTDIEPLRGLPALRILAARGWSISDDFSALAESPLTSLQLSGNKEVRLATVAGLTSLKALQLMRCSLMDCSDLAPLQLQRLSLVSNVELEDISMLNLTACKELLLAGTGVGDIRNIATAKHLRHLSLNNSPVTDLSPLRHCKSLTHLFVMACPVADISPLAECKRLRHVDLEGSPVTDLAPLGECADLITVDVRGTRVEDLKPLAQLPKLRTVHAGGLPDAAVAEFRSMRPEVRVNSTWHVRIVQAWTPRSRRRNDASSTSLMEALRAVARPRLDG